MTFVVVVNHEEQYSIWPKERDIPPGWVAVGAEGAKSDCLDYIERVWTDMRPRSLRLAARDDSSSVPDASPPEADDDLQRHVNDTLSHHADRVDEYADGRPELFGWFLARVLDAAEVRPDAARAELNRQLPSLD